MNSKFAKWSLAQLLTIVMIVAAGSAFAAGESLMHNSGNVGTKYGTWGVAGGTYGEFTCTTCHNKSTSNVKRIVDSIPNTIGPNVNKPVKFNNMTGFGNDSGGHATSFRICEVCHTQTKYHQYNTANAPQSGDLSHPNNDCTSCHKHADAFKASCVSCHGHNVASGSPIATGNHAAHINNQSVLGVNYSCADCHAPTMSSDDNFSNVSNHQNSTVNYGGVRAGTFTTGSCTATCHTDGKGGAAATTVNWSTGPALDCKGCHGGGSSQAGEPVYTSGAAGSATANSHPKHVGIAGANATCQNCHGATMSGTGLNASGKHTDQTIDVVQGNSKTFTYTSGSKTCSTASCHSNGFFTAAAVQWGATLNCAGCHATTALSTGNHNKHLNATISSSFNCGNCHADTAQNNTALAPATTTHINGALNVKFDTATNPTGNFTNPGCASLYCHSDGSKASSYTSKKAAPTWGGAAVTCTSCHGGPQMGGAAFTSLSTGRHRKHLNKYAQFTCDVCHAATVSGNAVIIDPTKHVNNQINVSFQGIPTIGGSAASFSSNDHAPGVQTGTCSTVYCHSNAQIQQAGVNLIYRNMTGAKMWFGAAGLNCGGCHGNTSGFAVTSLSGKHGNHLSLTVNPNMGKVRACNDCHLSGGSNLNKANHADGLANYSGIMTGGQSNLKISTGRCSTVYCHSDGKGTFRNMSTNNWFSANTLGCNGCHGDTATASDLSGKHNAHINNATEGGNYGCVDCHASTVVSSTTVNTLGNHVNALKNFSGARAFKTGFVAGAGTCSNSCHTDGKGNAVAPPLWTSASTLDCSGCHAAGAIATGGHQAHLVHGGITCANCHNSTTNTGTTITGSTHIDGTVELQAGSTFNSQAVSFTPAGNGCNNISCHGGTSTPDWSAKATCETCHPKAGLSGSHAVHMGAIDLTSSAVMYNMTANRTLVQNDTVKTHGFGCANCHPMDKASHLNGFVNVDMSSKNVTGTSSIRFLNSTTAGKLPTYSGGTCANIYCHSNASRVTAELVYKATPVWVGGTFSGDRCAACHDNQPATGAHAAHAVGNHVDNVYNGKSGKITVSNRANTTHGNPENSTTIGCYICHQATVTSKANDKNTKCAVCHYSGNTVGATLKGSASISNLKNHVNGAREIAFLPVKVISKAQVRPKGPLNPSAIDKRSGFDFYSGIWSRTSYKNMTTLSFDTAKVALDTATMWHPSTPMASNCTNIACHNGRTVSWNLANWNDPNKCMDCHNAL